MAYESLASNLLLGAADTRKFETSRPVSMAGANSVQTTVTVIRTSAGADTLNVHVEGVDNPNKRWQSITSFSAGSTAQAITATVAVPFAWARLGYEYTALAAGKDLVLDADINTSLT
ncbi:MAG: hypothetical protein ACE5F1_06520 [Planctomycetota bacterium]